MLTVIRGTSRSFRDNPKHSQFSLSCLTLSLLFFSVSPLSENIFLSPRHFVVSLRHFRFFVAGLDDSLSLSVIRDLVSLVGGQRFSPRGSSGAKKRGLYSLKFSISRFRFKGLDHFSSPASLRVPPFFLVSFLPEFFLGVVGSVQSFSLFPS